MTESSQPGLPRGLTVSRWKSRASVKWIVLVAIIASGLVWLRFVQHATASSVVESLRPGTMTKPEGFKIIGLLFYGRRSTIEILECYLRKNLVSHGGYLDEIHFVINTHNEEDLGWLSDMVKQVEDYKWVDISDGVIQDFNRIYNETIEHDHMYVKLDDDLVWMSPNAVPTLVHTLMDHPEAFAVIAALINSATLGWVQYRLGAVRSYLPEPDPPFQPNEDAYGPKAWRASALPTYKLEIGGKIEDFPNTEKSGAAEHAPVGSIGAAPYTNHRWLPLRDESLLPETPIAHTEYLPDGQGWKRWAIGAQQHYSLLENLENGQLHKYYIGEDGIWNMRYDRTNVNLLAIWGNDILDNLPFEGADDEQLISVELPRKHHRQNLVQTHALTAHFSFAVQPEMYDTDLLSRYRAYANEMVCSSNNQIPIR